jgi:hypothetical protein
MFSVLFGATILARMQHTRRTLGLVAAGVALIACGNLTASVWPRHATVGTANLKAACIAEHIGQDDLFVAVDWDSALHLNYFHGRRVFDLIDAVARSRDKEFVMSVLATDISHTMARGARAHMADLQRLPADRLAWLESQTGLTRTDFDRFERQPSFACPGMDFQQLTPGGMPLSSKT